MKYKISSYLLQDNRWGCAFQQPPSFDGQSATFSESSELGQYFPTKEEADRYTVEFLKAKGINEKDIEL